MHSAQHAAVKPLLRRPLSENARAIDWSTFLNRPLFMPSCLDCDTSMAGKTVLVTGAGGSIGSVLAERLMGGLAGTLILLDHSQHNLLGLYCKYKERRLTLPRVEFFHADILHEAELEEIFSTYSPQIVFHAAAMKHVAALESNPFQALENNVLGTLRILGLVDSWEVEHFVNVSTDKAVNPTSVLGVSKRISELLLLAMKSVATRRISLRLGNVLGSSGSVVPLFLQSLEDHLPLQITDPQASRFFLTLEEAAAFLLKTLEIGSGLLLPEMGSPLRITELADFLLNELPADICGKLLNFTGLRDGEKLSEQLTYDYERRENTSVHQLYKINGNATLDNDEFADNLGRLLDLIVDRREAGVIKALSRLVPEFKPSATLLRYVH